MKKLAIAFVVASSICFFNTASAQIPVVGGWVDLSKFKNIDPKSFTPEERQKINHFHTRLQEQKTPNTAEPSDLTEPKTFLSDSFDASIQKGN